MERKLEYSFDDEIANKFCYDMDNKKIEIHFGGYYDALSSQYIDKPCIWVIENWADAKANLVQKVPIMIWSRHLGIVSMVLSAEINKTSLELTVNTIDNRYIDLLFDSPQLSLR